MVMPSTSTALRTRRYDSTWYIPGTIHRLNFEPMDGGGRYIFQPPIVSDLSTCVVRFNSADYTARWRGLQMLRLGMFHLTAIRSSR